MKLKSNFYLFSMLAITVLLLGSCKDQAPQAATTPRGPTKVDYVVVTTEPVPMEIELPGRTAAFRIAEVRPQVNGIIQKRLFTEGSEVKAGQLLYQIDPAIYQAQYDSAKATLAKAEAIEHSARLKAERYTSLVKTKAVSELDQVEIEASWQQAKADVASAKAALNSARINLDYTRITAPISGRIGKTLISEGALVTAQQSSALAIIQQLDPIYVDVTQSSNEMLQLKKELSNGKLEKNISEKSDITILFEDGSVYSKPGSVEFSDVTVEQSTGTVTLRARVENPDEDLLPGMFLRARISKGVQQHAVLIPASSLSRNKRGQAMVMLVNDESTVEARIVQSGRTIGSKILILDGLSGGEKLITAGLQKIRPGVPVTAEQSKAGTPAEVAKNTDSTDSGKKAE